MVNFWMMVCVYRLVRFNQSNKKLFFFKYLLNVEWFVMTEIVHYPLSVYFETEPKGNYNFC